MKKEENNLHRFKSLSELHRILGLPKPLHPLISLIRNDSNAIPPENLPSPFILNFYKIAYKPNISGKFKYGQSYYDFDEGGLCFSAPNQLKATSDNDSDDHTGLGLFIHPDFFLGYPLAKKIKQYSFFSYELNESLHLSEKEKETIISVFNIIEEELNSRIDDFSQDVVIAQIDLLLTYTNRFYKRQFITRKAVNNTVFQKLERILNEYFDDEKMIIQGIPTVQQLAEQVNISPSYLSDLLRSLLGQNAQQFIHQKLIDKAKEKLSSTTLSVSEIAYELGFEHPQSFSRLFKAKTKQGPLEFRAKFN
ncbi:helix-turn-helix transcriptional regulator [Chryseobacterium tructae]|uniref:Helix-turn-helix domain-containing protein n=1 Tax=Chryseobacterium tructae TaxID=1037380 RepID=A0ABV7XZ09_9FLAO|nr:helix-turn-helix transcriptional regulator [Chryseobacterium tructae]MDN3693244.1 helix-turn-helix transcriptional regulator [Chryseobacterium tructae]